MQNPIDYYQGLPAAPQAAGLYLHHWLQEQGLRPKMNYGIPFYYGQKWVCYLNFRTKSDDFELCFTRAFQFEDPTGLLQSHGRKQIKGLALNPHRDLPISALREILETALTLDSRT